MLTTHQKNQADVTIAALPVDASQAAAIGIMRIDDSGRVVGFLEKPKTAARNWTSCAPIRPGSTHGRSPAAAATAGQHGHLPVQSRDAGRRADEDRLSRFRQRGLSGLDRARTACRCHLFDGYWEDIGTIKSFYRGQPAIWPAAIRRSISFEPRSPIYTRAASCRRRASTAPRFAAA